MSKAKLTIENIELEKFKSCVQLAGMRILEIQNIGSLNQVLTYYKTEQQLVVCGRYMEKIKDNPELLHVDFKKPVKKATPSTKKKIKS